MAPVVPMAPADGKDKEKDKASSTDVPVSISGIPASRAQVVVRMPADAKLFADGQATTLTGAERVFQTPDLTPGRDFQYTLKIEGTAGQAVSKQVLVRAGHRTVVNFLDTTERATTPITVNLPEKAKLFVDGMETPAAGGSHTFQTPELTKGKSYVYSFRAEVEREGKTSVTVREVTFRGGEPVTVDFTETSAVRTASVR